MSTDTAPGHLYRIRCNLCGRTTTWHSALGDARVEAAEIEILQVDQTHHCCREHLPSPEGGATPTPTTKTNETLESILGRPSHKTPGPPLDNRSLDTPPQLPQPDPPPHKRARHRRGRR